MEYEGGQQQEQQQQQQSTHYTKHHDEEFQQTRSSTSRNTYERREKPNQPRGNPHNGGIVQRPATADEVLYYADDDMNAYCDNSIPTLPHGFKFSRAPIPAPQQSSQLPMEHPQRRVKQQYPTGNSYPPSSFERVYPTTNQQQHMHSNKETQQHVHHSSLTRANEYNGGEHATKKGRNDSCEICNTTSAAPIAGAVPMSILIE